MNDNRMIIKLEKHVWNIKVATSAASVQIFPLNIRVSTYNLNKLTKYMQN